MAASPPEGGAEVVEEDAPAALRLGRVIGRGTFSTVLSVAHAGDRGPGEEAALPASPATTSSAAAPRSASLALKALHPHLLPTKEAGLLMQEGRFMARLQHR